MVESGLIKRYVLPSIINFREVLFSYIVLSLLLLFSPRASFLYLPVIALTLLSLYAIWVAIKVIFEQRKLKNKEDNHIMRLVRTVFDIRLKTRILNNNYFETLKTQDVVNFSFLDPFEDDEMNTLEIRTRKKGRVKSIDVNSLISLMQQNYPPSEITENASETQEALKQVTVKEPKLRLNVRPGSGVQRDGVLMRLLLPKETEQPDKRFLHKLEKTVEIVPDDDNSADNQLNDLIADFKQQLRDTIDKDNVILIEQSLEFYRLLLGGLSEFSKALTDPGYTLENARQEFRSAWGMDSVSEQLNSISDIISDEFLHALREGKKDTSVELVRFMYSDLLQVSRKQDVMAIARADHIFISAMNTVLYAESRDIPSTPLLNKISNDLLFRFKEQTSLLLYRLREEELDKVILNDWLKLRLNDLRSFLLGAYTKSNLVMFKDFLNITSEYFVERRYYEEPEIGDELTKLTRCNLLMVAAFVEGRENASEQQTECRKLLFEQIGSWQANELTLALIECIDNDYSHKWNIDTRDLPMDGQMHSVPDYGNKLRDVWIRIMLNYLRTFPDQLNYYPDLPLATTDTFTSGLTDNKDAYLLQRLSSMSENNDKAKLLEKLVEEFISVRRDWLESKLVEAPLSNKMIGEFKAAVLNGYKDGSITYKIFSETKRLILVKRTDGNFKRLGWNEVKDKEAFIEDWHIGYYMPGDQYGSEIGRFQDRVVADEMFSKAKPLNMPDLVKRMRKSKSGWLLIGRNVGGWYIQQKFQKFLDKTDVYSDIKFKGVSQPYPVQIFYDQTKAKGLYAIKLEDIGKLNIKPFYNQPIEVSVSAYSHNEKLLTEILDEPPAWLVKKGNKQEQEKFLKTKVRMLINYIYKYEPKKSLSSFYVSLDEDQP